MIFAAFTSNKARQALFLCDWLVLVPPPHAGQAALWHSSALTQLVNSQSMAHHSGLLLHHQLSQLSHLGVYSWNIVTKFRCVHPLHSKGLVGWRGWRGRSGEHWRAVEIPKKRPWYKHRLMERQCPKKNTEMQFKYLVLPLETRSTGVPYV
jgi:hypothetical protein